MESFSSALAHLEFVTPSGTRHPYFAVRSERMFARVTSYPSLGHETVVPSGKRAVSFNVLVESDPSKEEQHWEVQLWHNLHDPLKWENLDFKPATPRLCLSQTELASKLRRQWFTTTLEGNPSSPRPVSFTVKFRAHRRDNWKWVQSQSGTRDGRLLYQENEIKRQDLKHYINDIDSNLNIKQEQSDTPDAAIWSVTAPAKPAKGEESGFTEYSLGIPTSYTRWFSLVRLWSPWLAPRHGIEPPLAEKDGVMYSFLREDGLHVVALAISGLEDILTTFKAEQDKLIILARNDREEEGTTRVIVAVGKSFDAANAAAMYYARKLLSTFNAVSPEMEEIIKTLDKKGENGDVHASWVQSWVDGMSYCTWNGLGQALTEEKISGALESLKREDIKVMNLIIDDNWQDINNEGQSQMVQGWKGFEANTKGFPEGLKSAITKIRQKHPNINHIGVWHALLGYWGGIAPEGELAKTYKTVEVQKRKDVVGGKITVIDAPDVTRFYNDFYTFLEDAGVDSVKTDAQFWLDEIISAPARRSLTMTYLNAWMTSQLRHFSGRAISCMSQTPQILFHSQLPQHLPALPVRNNDDFFPDIDASHPWHIFCNAHNALFTKHLNVLPDWDMFQTVHPWASFHAAARAVSGGPIYITDEPGKHDVALIKQLTATTPLDQTVILRPSVVGRTVQAYIGFEEEKICVVAAYHGRSGIDASGSFIGVFNCKDRELAEILPLSDFIGTEAGVEYVIRGHRTGKLSKVVTLRDEESAVVAVEVSGRGWEILTATPVRSLSHHSDIKISNLGLVGKMTGAAAIISSSVRLDDSGARVRVATTLKALGVWGVWISSLEEMDINEDIMVLLEGKPVPVGRLMVSFAESSVLEIDVERAWKEMGLQAKYSNEVDVELFVKVRKGEVDGVGK